MRITENVAVTLEPAKAGLRLALGCAECGHRFAVELPALAAPSFVGQWARRHNHAPEPAKPRPVEEQPAPPAHEEIASWAEQVAAAEGQA